MVPKENNASVNVNADVIGGYPKPQFNGENVANNLYLAPNTRPFDSNSIDCLQYNYSHGKYILLQI